MQMGKYLWHVICQRHKEKRIWVVKRCTCKTYERRLKYKGEDYLYYTCENAARAEAVRRNALEL